MTDAFLFGECHLRAAVFPRVSPSIPISGNPERSLAIHREEAVSQRPIGNAFTHLGIGC